MFCYLYTVVPFFLLSCRQDVPATVFHAVMCVYPFGCGASFLFLLLETLRAASLPSPLTPRTFCTTAFFYSVIPGLTRDPGRCHARYCIALSPCHRHPRHRLAGCRLGGRHDGAVCIAVAKPPPGRCSPLDSASPPYPPPGRPASGAAKIHTV